MAIRLDISLPDQQRICDISAIETMRFAAASRVCGDHDRELAAGAAVVGDGPRGYETWHEERRSLRKMTTHALYVTAAYAITVVVLAGLIGWILLDQRARRRELAELEAAGIRRRSDRTKSDRAKTEKGAAGAKAP